MNIKKLYPHLLALLGFIIISCVYFQPSLEGRKLKQADITSWEAMSKEIKDYRKTTGQEALWTNSLFSGMPAFQISTIYKNNFIRTGFAKFTQLFPTPIVLLIISLLGFYILFLSLKIPPLLAFSGAIAGAFTSYFFIIIEAGHITKAYAIAYIPYVISGFYLTIKKRHLLGIALFAISLLLEVGSNHLQITYYLLIILLFFGLYLLFEAVKNKKLKPFFINVSILIGVALLVAASQSSNLLLTNEYSKETMRGKSELTDANNNNKTDGLNKDYATQWSYGKMETFTLISPNFMGGESGGEHSQNSVVYNTLLEKGVPKGQAKKHIKQMPLYWGTQPFTSGPTYIGAISCFLLVLGFFILDKKWLWGFIPVTILGIMLAWGKNFMPLTDFFMTYIPLYNKFRAVSMTLVIPSFTIAFLAILTIKKIIDTDNLKTLEKPLKITGGITVGLLLFFILTASSLFSFEGLSDGQLPEWLRPAIIADRISIMQSDLWRSIGFIVAFIVATFLFIRKIINVQIFIVATAILFIVDLWPVNKRYLNKGNYDKRKRKTEFKLEPSQADLQILQDPDPHYRVLNLAVNTFNDATTSYFHKSVGGYHGAKLGRYQELIEHHIAKGNINVLNMLNTKYIIQNIKGQLIPQLNNQALGNAWFVNEYKFVANADSEIVALNGLNTATTLVVDKRFENELSNLQIQPDSSASIKLTKYDPKHLSYESKTNSEQLAVFSEIYYDKGWNAYIDGKLTPHIRGNYVLRALRVPKGTHTIDFKFEPKTLFITEKIALITNILIMLLIAFCIFAYLKKANGYN